MKMKRGKHLISCLTVCLTNCVEKFSVELRVLLPPPALPFTVTKTNALSRVLQTNPSQSIVLLHFFVRSLLLIAFSYFPDNEMNQFHLFLNYFQQAHNRVCSDLHLSETSSPQTQKK